MDIETKMELVKSEPTEEIITEQEMRHLLETNSSPKHYIGFEISGIPHLGTVFCAAKKINDLEKAGVKTQIYLADWHSMANLKMNGDWDRIMKGAEFYKKLFSIVCPNSKIILGSDLYHNNDDYWKLIIKMASRTTMARATRTLIIQGRSEKDTLHVSQYLYPIMQAADIHALDAGIPHAGMDQRKVHVLAKELFKDLKMGTIVPLHHHLLPSLLEPPKVDASMDKEEIAAARKMSKSKPGSGIFILDSKEEVSKNINGAWCPEGVVEENPVLLMCKYLIMPMEHKLKVERSSKYGGDVEYTSYTRLEEDYREKKLHPVDLKKAVASEIWGIIEPVSSKFDKDKERIRAMFKA